MSHDPDGMRERTGVGLVDLFRDQQGIVYRVTGIATTPTVTLVPVDDKLAEDHATHRHLVIGSLLFDQMEQLIPKEQP